MTHPLSVLFSALAALLLISSGVLGAQTPSPPPRDTIRVDSTKDYSLPPELVEAGSPKARDSLVASSLRSLFVKGVITVSDDSVDRLRIASIADTSGIEGLMLRSTSSLMDRRHAFGSGTGFSVVMPTVYLAANSELPFGQNDGALWAGKGLNLRALAGFTVTAGPIRLVVIPELTRSSNSRLSIDPTDTSFVPRVPSSRSVFSSPFNVYPYSIDLPWRMGDLSFTKIYGGQSSLTVGGPAFQIGAATENEWWGPAIRNPLVMSDNAPGFPHLFLRTRGPVQTIAGRFDARWIVGGLKESDFFDNDTRNDIRSLSAIALTWASSRTSPFTFGFTRSVFAPADGYGQAATRWFDALRNTGHPDAHALTDSTMTPGPDQIFSLFGRAALPRYGLETYLEWGRADFPVSLRDFLEEPIHSRAYTIGAQWVLPAGDVSRVRVQGEITNVEQSTTYRFRPQGSFYTSRAVVQGYTNEGQLIGAGLGPGSSGGWFAADYLRSEWQLGVTWGRVRFDNDAFFLRPYANRCGHDVTVFPGARAGFTNEYLHVFAQVSPGSRYNTFFQNKTSCEAGGDGSDRSNTSFSLTVASFGW